MSIYFMANKPEVLEGDWSYSKAILTIRIKMRFHPDPGLITPTNF